MEKEITMEELVKMVNESSDEIIIHVELGEERDSDSPQWNPVCSHKSDTSNPYLPFSLL